LQDPSADIGAEPIGVRLKHLRLERGLSQRDLSSPGVSYAYISRIEAGARTPSVKALRMLAQKLQVSVEYLETGRDMRDVDERELRLADAELELRVAGNPGEAERKLDELLEEARRAGDARCVTRAEIALGLVAARRGNHLDTVERLEPALAGGTVAAHSRPDAFAVLGQAYTALGAPDRAVRLFEQCRADVREQCPKDVGTHVRYSTLLSDALDDAGDHDRAAETIRGAVAQADDAVGSHARARQEWSLAHTAASEGRSTEGLEHIRRALALLDITEQSAELARAQLVAAGVEAAAGRVEETRARLERADRLLGAAPEPRELALLHIGRARLATLEGDGSRAVAFARQALEALGDFQGRDEGAAFWALADGLAVNGDTDEASETFRRAVDLLAIHGRRHDAARACRRWGEILQDAGRADEAAVVLQHADELDLREEDRAVSAS
jgi:transcriptional regulator with XRE-family HTH domain